MVPVDQWSEWHAMVVAAGAPLSLVVMAAGIRCLRRKFENAIHASLLSGYQKYLRVLAENSANGASHDSMIAVNEEHHTRAMARLLLVLFEEAYVSMHGQPWPMMRNRH